MTSLAGVLPVAWLSWHWLSSRGSWGAFLLTSTILTLWGVGCFLLLGGKRDWRELKDLIRPHGEEEHLPLPVQL